MMKVLSIRISKEKERLFSPIPKISLTKQGILDDPNSEIFNYQIPIIITNNPNFQATENSQENIIIFYEKPESIQLLDIIENEHIKLQIVMSSENCKMGSTFDNGLKCSLPSGGFFVRVIEEGYLEQGSSLGLTIKTIRTKIITLSDRASKGIYEDLSGKKIEEMLKQYFSTTNRFISFEKTIISDEATFLKDEIINTKKMDFDLIFTTGGTGIGKRDITPETIKPLIDKEITGIMELIRVKYGAIKHNALISRSIAGVLGNSLIYCLPGSQKAVEEYMTEIIPTLMHSIFMLHDVKAH